LSPRALLQLQMVTNHMKLGRWMRDRGFVFESRAKDRRGVWDVVAQNVANQRVLYLEFGVFSGESMRYWSHALKHPGSVLHGFDSFEGLPEEAGRWSKGEFSTGGQIPKIDDPRVQFFKGWFDAVLPTYTVPSHDLLVINMDADLYSSTIYVLRHLRQFIKPGTFIYFDEMNHMDHEPKAFDEFVAESGLAFRPVSADRTLSCVFLECYDRRTQ
jgi:O-methyltransferase